MIREAIFILQYKLGYVLSRLVNKKLVAYVRMGREIGPEKLYLLIQNWLNPYIHTILRQGVHVLIIKTEVTYGWNCGRILS